MSLVISGQIRGFKSSNALLPIIKRYEFEIDEIRANEFEFAISASIIRWVSGQELGTFQYNQRPRIMVGVFDNSSPNGYDYKPSIGIEFNMDFKNGSEAVYAKADNVCIPLNDTGCYDSIGGSNPITNRWLSQIFTISTSCIINAVEFYMGYRANNDTENVKVELRGVDTSLNKPNNTIYASGIIYYSKIPTGIDTDWVLCNLNPSIEYQPGKYAFVLHKDPSTYVTSIWRISGEDYDGGRECYTAGEPSGPSSWSCYSDEDLAFKAKGPPKHHVRTFIANNITEDNITKDIYAYGNWVLSGSTDSYKVRLKDSNLYLYVDGKLEDELDITNVMLDGNYKFTKEYYYNWNGFKVHLVDSLFKERWDNYSGAVFHGNIYKFNINALGNELAVSYDSGTTWTKYYDRHINQIIGWNYDYIVGSYTAPEENISKYGLHIYKVNEPLITNREDADTLAKRYVETYMSGLKTGKLIINGRTGISLQSKFRLSGSYMNENELLQISSFSQLINENGFTTEINYGSEPFDIAKKVSNLESAVYGS